MLISVIEEYNIDPKILDLLWETQEKIIFIHVSFANGIQISGKTYDVKDVLKNEFNCRWLGEEKRWKVRETGVNPPNPDPELRWYRGFLESEEWRIIEAVSRKMITKKYGGLTGDLKREFLKFVKMRPDTAESLLRDMRFKKDEYSKRALDIAKKVLFGCERVAIIVSHDFNYIRLGVEIEDVIRRVRENFLERYSYP